MALFDFQWFRGHKSQEFIESGLLTCGHMVRSIPLQRRNLATRQVIQMGCQDYVPEIVSNKGFDGTVLRYFFCWLHCVQRGGFQFV